MLVVLPPMFRSDENEALGAARDICLAKLADKGVMLAAVDEVLPTHAAIGDQSAQLGAVQAECVAVGGRELTVA